MTDPIGDFIIRLKNASAAGRDSLSVPYSELKSRAAEVLREEGFIKSSVKRGKKSQKFIDIELFYNEKKPRIHGVRRISKPSRRLYLGHRDILPVKQGFGLSVISTPAGVMSGRDARKLKVGGEPLFEIW